MTIRFDTCAQSGDRRSRTVVGRTAFAVAAFVVEIAVILAVALAMGTGYHLIVYNDMGLTEKYLAIGGIAALAYTLPFVFREEYSVQAYLDGHRDFERTFIVWKAAFLGLAVVGFLTKSTEVASRGMLVLFLCGRPQRIDRHLCIDARGAAIAHLSPEVDRAARDACGSRRGNPLRSVGPRRAPVGNSNCCDTDAASDLTRSELIVSCVGLGTN